MKTGFVQWMKSECTALMLCNISAYMVCKTPYIRQHTFMIQIWMFKYLLYLGVLASSKSSRVKADVFKFSKKFEGLATFVTMTMHIHSAQWSIFGKIWACTSVRLRQRQSEWITYCHIWTKVVAHCVYLIHGSFVTRPILLQISHGEYVGVEQIPIC